MNYAAIFKAKGWDTLMGYDDKNPSKSLISVIFGVFVVVAPHFKGYVAQFTYSNSDDCYYEILGEYMREHPTMYNKLNLMSDYIQDTYESNRIAFLNKQRRAVQRSLFHYWADSQEEYQFNNKYPHDLSRLTPKGPSSFSECSTPLELPNDGNFKQKATISIATPLEDKVKEKATTIIATPSEDKGQRATDDTTATLLEDKLLQKATNQIATHKVEDKHVPLSFKDEKQVLLCRLVRNRPHARVLSKATKAIATPICEDKFSSSISTAQFQPECLVSLVPYGKILIAQGVLTPLGIRYTYLECQLDGESHAIGRLRPLLVRAMMGGRGRGRAGKRFTPKPLKPVRTGLSECAKDYLKVLENPFSGAVACVPTTSNFPTQKYSVRALGNASTGTTSVGFVCVSPFIGMWSSAEFVSYSAAAYNGNGIANGQNQGQAASNSPFAVGTSALAMKARVVGCGLRVRNVTPLMHRGGTLIGCESIGHTTLVGLQASNLLAMDTSDRVDATSGSWSSVVFHPQDDDEYDYFSSADDFDTPMLAFLFEQVGAEPQTYEWEAYLAFECKGTSVHGLTPSFSDPSGLAVIQNSTAMVRQRKPMQGDRQSIISRVLSSAQELMTSTISGVLALPPPAQAAIAYVARGAYRALKPPAQRGRGRPLMIQGSMPLPPAFPAIGDHTIVLCSFLEHSGPNIGVESTVFDNVHVVMIDPDAYSQGRFIVLDQEVMVSDTSWHSAFRAFKAGLHALVITGDGRGFVGNFGKKNAFCKHYHLQLQLD